MADNERVILSADFNDAVTTYWLLTGVIICIVTIVLIPVLPFWIVIGKVVTRRYLASHECTLTDRSLKFKKGILTKLEKTVPLDRITDLGTLQGPIMRYFEIDSLSVETAGQSSAGALIRITGIKDSRAFRDAVLQQRDLVVGSAEQATGPSSTQIEDKVNAIQLLTEIRDTLNRIENKSK